MSAHRWPWATAHIDLCRTVENDALRLVLSVGGGGRTRKRLAEALRGWRSIGDHERARWLIRHAHSIRGEVVK